MNATTRKPAHMTLFLGLAAGVALTITTALLMGQSDGGGAASTLVKSDTQYFVTGEGDDAHLWVREGATLRCVGHGACKTHAHGEDGHDHDHDAPKKP